MNKTDALTGRLLVASPQLVDPNFARSVVLLLDHSDEGAVGVILNKASPRRVTDSLPDWSPLVADPDLVFLGGPVSTEAVIGLGVARYGVMATGLTPVVDRVSVIDLRQGPEVVHDAVESVRLMIGYSGWGPGQLEEEIEEGAWIVVNAYSGDAVDDHPETMWRRVLKRQNGRISMLATFPEDPSAN